MKKGDFMIRCKVIKDFTLEDYDKLKNIKRRSIDNYGYLYYNDTFECDEKMCDYLLGNNKNKDIVIKIIEIIPEKKGSD